MDAKILWENAPIEVKLHKFWNGCAKSTKLKNIYHEITHKPKKIIIIVQKIAPIGRLYPKN